MKKFICVLLSGLLLLSFVGCSNQPDDNQSSEIPSVDNSSNIKTDDVPSDDRGISGMKTFPIRSILAGDPFQVETTDAVPAPEESVNTFAYSYTSSGSGQKGVLYDYSITADNDDEIIGASFGVTSTTASEAELLVAADLFFYTVSIMKYDTANDEILTGWFEENLKTANENGTTITVGDATYTLYGTPGLMYFVDISKTV